MNKFGLKGFILLLSLLTIQLLVMSKEGIAQYGKFCGTGQNDVPLYKSGKKKVPIDSLDEVCEKHDECYRKYPGLSSPSGYTEGIRHTPCICQRQLRSNLNKVKFQTGKSTPKFYPTLAAAYLYLDKIPCLYKNKKGKVSSCGQDLDDVGVCYNK